MIADASSVPTLEDLAPILYYDSRELYGAVAVESFVGNHYDGGPGAAYANTLKRADGTVIATVGGEPALTLAFLRAGEYPTGDPVLEGDYLDAGHAAYAADSRTWWSTHGDVVYAREVMAASSGRRWFQYWIFYYYNSKQIQRLGLHEGDWEMIQIGLDDAGHPWEVTYSQHGKPLKATWSDVEEDGRPAVFVALGSHASLPTAGRHPAPVIDDYCDALGRRSTPRVIDVTAGSAGWLAWTGRWGASRKAGFLSFPSPSAPVTQRPWSDPDGFHGDARRWEPSTEVSLAFARRPIVTVSGSGGKRTVEFEVFPDREDSWVALLTIHATLPGDQPPREFIFDVTTPGEKEPVSESESFDGVGKTS